jgi:hypothetical protein
LGTVVHEQAQGVGEEVVAVEALGDWRPDVGRPLFPIVGREILPGCQAPAGLFNVWTRLGVTAEEGCTRKGQSERSLLGRGCSAKMRGAPVEAANGGRGRR